MRAADETRKLLRRLSLCAKAAAAQRCQLFGQIAGCWDEEARLIAELTDRKRGIELLNKAGRRSVTADKRPGTVNSSMLKRGTEFDLSCKLLRDHGRKQSQLLERQRLDLDLQQKRLLEQVFFLRKKQRCIAARQRYQSAVLRLAMDNKELAELEELKGASSILSGAAGETKKRRT
jgi:hypothetical protein